MMNKNTAQKKKERTHIQYHTSLNTASLNTLSFSIKECTLPNRSIVDFKAITISVSLGCKHVISNQILLTNRASFTDNSTQNFMMIKEKITSAVSLFP